MRTQPLPQYDSATRRPSMSAGDVYIHHWGWTSFGKLSQAEYDQVFEANRQYFEEKWQRQWRRLPLKFDLASGKIA